MYTRVQNVVSSRLIYKPMQYREILLETIYIPKVNIFNSNVNIGPTVKVYIIYFDEK